MSVGYRSTCRPTIGQSVHIDRYRSSVGRHMSTDTSRPTYRSRGAQNTHDPISLHIGLFVNVFLPLSLTSPFLLLTQCDSCLEDCMGAPGLGRLPAMGQMVNIKVHRYPRHPPSTQHDTVVNHIMTIFCFHCLNQLTGKLIYRKLMQ